MSKKRKSGGNKPPESKNTARSTSTVKWVLVVGIAIAALLGAYLVASARSSGGAGGAGDASGAGVQKAYVAVSTVYTPSTVNLKAGEPAEITFSQGQGCTSVVKSEALGFREDLSSGPRTVSLKPLQPGTYDFECRMNMVHGTIVVH